MRGWIKGWILGIAVAAVVVSFLAVAAGGMLESTALAAPPVGGLSQRIETVAGAVPAKTTQEIQASCGANELLTGGGYQLGSIGFSDKVYVNAPLDESTWLVEVVNDTGFEIDVWAYAVCLRRGPGA